MLGNANALPTSTIKPPTVAPNPYCNASHVLLVQLHLPDQAVASAPLPTSTTMALLANLVPLVTRSALGFPSEPPKCPIAIALVEIAKVAPKTHMQTLYRIPTFNSAPHVHPVALELKVPTIFEIASAPATHS